MLGILEICCGFNAQLCASKAICVFDVNTPGTTILKCAHKFKKVRLKTNIECKFDPDQNQIQQKFIHLWCSNEAA